MKLTQTSVGRIALPKDATDKIFFDSDLSGFGLRIREGGSRKYVVHYRQGGLQRRHTIGSAAVLTLEEARKKARKVLVAVDDGKDPAIEKATKRAASSLIFVNVARDYLIACAATMKPRSHIECTRHLEKHWKPFHGLALASVARATVAGRLREIAKASGRVAANRSRGTLSAMYGWAIGEGLCEINPVNGTNKAEEGAPRDRVLSDAELVAIWKASPNNDFGRIVRLLMLTGQRRDEIGGLRWSEISTDVQLITLQAARTKNHRKHTIPLSGAAATELRAALCRTERDHLFGEGSAGYSGWSKAKAALDCTAKLTTAWTLHDLRRTAATRMADCGVQPHIIEAVLNHVSGHKSGVAGIYNRAAYEPEKRSALNTLALYIDTALSQAEGSNIRRLRA